LDYPVNLNELNVIDPCVMADPISNKYYIYSSSFNCGLTPRERLGAGAAFYAICSEDLLNWSNPILVFEQNDFWASEDYSAPEGHYYRGKYYIFASFSAPGKLRRCQALVSDNPLGPFSPISNEPLTPPAWQCMDCTLYVDGKGDPWLIFAHDWVQVYDGQICAMRLSEDLSKAADGPVILFRGSDASWGDDFMYSCDEGGGAACSPSVHKMRDGSLVMLWGNCTPEGYAVGVAKSRSGDILGPWEQFDEPVFDLDGAHAAIFSRLNDGQLMMTLHRADRYHPTVRTLFFELEENNSGLLEISDMLIDE